MAYSFTEIMARMLAHVPDSMDKREGSVIYDALAPAAYELSLAYQEMETYYKNTFAQTADRAGLVLRAEEYGIYPNPATYAIRRGYFTPTSIEISIGERFNLNELNYVVTEKVGDGEYLLRCETLGEAGNVSSGNLLPINYVPGLETAVLVPEVVIYGEDVENTEVFRQRFWESLMGDARDGNVAQYKKWANEFSGIGNVRVFSLWNGKNTVKVSILNSENGVASDRLVSEFQEYLDPGINGLGNGVAPIGAIVTVSTASVVPLDISGNVSLASGYAEPAGVREALQKFLNEIAYKKNTVSYMSLGAAIQNCPSIDFLDDFRVNGVSSNIVLEDEQICVINSINLVVV